MKIMNVNFVIFVFQGYKYNTFSVSQLFYVDRSRSTNSAGRADLDEAWEAVIIIADFLECLFAKCISRYF